MAATKPCPECGESVNAFARACSCGWKQGGKGATNHIDPLDMQSCYACMYQYVFPNFRAHKPDGNHIIGRSANGGYICKNCYEQGEHSHHVARDEFIGRHLGDMWQSLISASHGLDSKEDKIDMLKLLRKQLSGGFGLPLPYNQNATATEIDADTDAFAEQRTAELKERARRAVETYQEKQRQ